MSLAAIVLRCPREIAEERITTRHLDTGGRRAAAARIMGRDHVRTYLEQLDRSGITMLDATQPPEAVYARALQRLRTQRATLET